ncbi:MAG: trans-sulfuration enzyme family protein [Anaerolineae bacterium]
MPNSEYGVFTKAIHAGESPDEGTGAVAVPIHMANTFAFPTAEDAAATFAGEETGHIYTRWGNPTQAIMERRIAALDGGEAALATASGMAAISTAIMSVVKRGDHIVATKAIYSGTFNLLDKELPHFGVTTTFVDASDPQNIADVIRDNTRIVYLESPGNPTLTLNDIAAGAAIARQAGALTFVDNTFATPINQRPLELGADVVLYSATKYFCGHGDAIGGAIAGSRAFIENARTGILRDMGGIISPFNAWLILRGIQTLPLRVERHNANALQISRFLEEHEAVHWVAYPGLESHPQHHLARRQMRGYGGMVCFEVKGGVEAGARLMNHIKLCTLTVSLGDTKTLICHSASTTHSTVPAEARQAAGITDGLVRLSVGLEDPEDIMADLDQALAAI